MGLDFEGASQNLLTSEQRAEYEKVTGAAWAEYEKVDGAAWAEYQKVTGEALLVFKKAQATAFSTQHKSKEISHDKRTERPRHFRVEQDVFARAR